MTSDFDTTTRADWLRALGLATPLLIWPVLVRQGPAFLAATFLLVAITLLAAKTATQLITVLFGYFGVDGYLRLMFDYSWAIYVLPLIAIGFVYMRWFLGPQWRRYQSSASGNPLAVPLFGLVALYALQMFNGEPWNPVVSVGGFVYHLGCVPLFFIAVSGFRDSMRIRQVLWFVVGLAILECGYAVLQYHLGPSALVMLSEHFRARMLGEAWWAPSSNPSLIYRPTGLTLSGVGPGIYGFVGLLLTIGLVQNWRGSAWRAALALAGNFVMLLAIFLSAVRAFWLGLLVALLVFGVLQRVRYMPLVLAIGWGAASLVANWTHGALYARLSTLLTPWVAFSRERAGDLRALPSIIGQHPLGIGIGRVAGSAGGRAQELFSDGIYGGAHNYWVGITWESSLVAAILLAWLLWHLFKYGLKRFRTAPDRGTRSIIAAILAFDMGVVAMTFAGPVLAGVASSFAQYFWFLSGILFALPQSGALVDAPAFATVDAPAFATKGRVNRDNPSGRSPLLE